MVEGIATVKPRCAGVGSTLPAASTARTEKALAPPSRFGKLAGLVHDCQLDQPSNLHSKVEFASEEEKPKVTREGVTAPEGPEVIVVSGGVVSGVAETKAGACGLRPTFPGASVVS